MSTSQLEVGVVIPAFCMEAYVAEAIASVLAQEVAVQVVVVDDASTDATLDRAREALAGAPAAQVVPNGRTKGVCGARNTGLLALETPWVLFLDADDLLVPGALSALLNARRPGCSAVLGSFHTVDEQGVPVEGSWAGQRDEALAGMASPEELSPAQLARSNVMPPPGAQLLKVADLLEVGGFDEGPLALGWSEDAELLARLAHRGPVLHCTADVLAYRQRGGSLSTRPGWRREVARSRFLTVRRAPRGRRPGLGLAFASRYATLGGRRIAAGLRRARPSTLVNGLANVLLAAGFALWGLASLAWPAWSPSWALEDRS